MKTESTVGFMSMVLSTSVQNNKFLHYQKNFVGVKYGKQEIHALVRIYKIFLHQDLVKAYLHPFWQRILGKLSLFFYRHPCSRTWCLT